VPVAASREARERPMPSASGVHIFVCSTVRFVQADRLTVTMDAELGRAVRDAAAREAVSVSRWLTEAAARQLRNDQLGVALDAWEAELGAPTEEELEAATRLLTARSRQPA